MRHGVFMNRHAELIRQIDTQLVGMSQQADGKVAPCPPEHLLLQSGADHVAPGSIALAMRASGLLPGAENWLHEKMSGMVAEHRARIEESLPERRKLIERGHDHKTAELMKKRKSIYKSAKQGDSNAREEIEHVKEQQRQLAAEKGHSLDGLEAEPSQVEPGEITMIALALVVPPDDRDERRRQDAEVERIAMDVARAHEEAAGASVQDVSRPALARAAGLGDWPGFDLRSTRPAGTQQQPQERAIEVKGRTGSSAVDISDNEWAAACNLRGRYWLYAVFDCATPRPCLVKVQDPFSRLRGPKRKQQDAYTLVYDAPHSIPFPTDRLRRKRF